MQGQELLAFIVDKIDDMKGRDIITLDVRGKSSITDTMIICSGNSNRHVSAIAHNLASEVRHAGLDLLIVWADGRCHPITSKAADQVIALAEFRERNPTARRECRVVWGTGELLAVCSCRGHLDQLARIPATRRGPYLPC